MEIQALSVEAPYCFGDGPIRLTNMGKVNFIFAPNGAGKSTISNALTKQPCDPISRTNWHVAPTDLPIRVFNEAYREKVLTEQVDGIFTIGETSTDAYEKISELEDKKLARRKDREGWQKEIGSDSDPQNPEGLLGEIEAERLIARKDVFARYKQISYSAASRVFEGFRNNRDKFLEEAVRRFAASELSSTTMTWDDLESRATSLNSDSQTRSSLPSISTVSLISADEIADVGGTVTSNGTGEFANLIRQLQNEDWVSNGRQYLYNSPEKCPFCQQLKRPDLEETLQEYFASGFDEALERAREIQNSVHSRVQDLEQELLALETGLSQDPEIGVGNIDALISRVRTDANLLLARVQEKTEHPTRPVNVVDVKAAIIEVSNYVDAENQKVKQHNKLTENLVHERKRLIDDGWALFLLDPGVSSALKRLNGKSMKCKSRLESLHSNINSSKNDDAEDEQKIAELRKTLSNTADVAQKINHLLKAMGFHRFRLQVAHEATGGYRLVREDGTPAFDSLSEGERSFICFAYFWESLFGSDVSGGEPEDLVAVFDDPISSLDSDTLFMVAAHIRDAAQQVIKGTNNLRQLIVLTHNTQFHQEAAYFSDTSTRKHRRFYRLLKELNGVTSARDDGIQSKIRGSYSVLWQSIVEAARTSDESDLIQVGVFNIVRRILEGYFKTIGNIKDYERPGHLSTADQKIIYLFHIWANSGSHTIADDFDHTSHVGSVKHFLRLFQAYFVIMGHEAHFNMMVEASEGGGLLEPGGLFERDEALDALGYNGQL